MERSIVIGLLLLVLVAACAQKVTEPKFETQLANPASTNCIDKGGTVDIRTEEGGGQYGVCILSDGTECEEWEYYRGDCPA